MSLLTTLKRQSAGIAYPSITGLELRAVEFFGVNYWTGALAIAVVDPDGNNVMPTTLVSAGSGNDFTSIVAGEYTSNTTYVGSTGTLDPVHAWDKTPSDGNTHWFTSGQGTRGSFFIKFASAISLAQVQVAGWHFHLAHDIIDKWRYDFYDQDGNPLTPITSPSSKTDRNGDKTIDGVTAIEDGGDRDCHYKWTFA